MDVIKMDIKENEPYALEGMKKIIAKSKNLILFTELVPTYLCRVGVQVGDYLKQLEGFGFEVQVIDEQAHCLKPFHEAHIMEGDPSWHVNLYCKKRN